MRNRCVPLIRWSVLFERLSILDEKDKTYLRKIIDTLLQLSDYEQLILTNKYYNLNEGSSFNTRVKDDRLLSEGMEMDLNEFRISLINATKSFNEKWVNHNV